VGVETKDLPAQKLFSFEHTGVIVTGGARGLGLCMATALLEALAPYVYCLDILPSPVEEEWQLAEQASKSFGGVIEYHQLDITDGPAVTRVMSQLFETCPVPIAAFFGAAGIQQMIPAVDYPAADFRRIMDVNVTGESEQSGAPC
jgi:NAD(P)-dependent dehydrogenase (short-subunit alcohol dehydrogenase family)